MKTKSISPWTVMVGIAALVITLAVQAQDPQRANRFLPGGGRGPAMSEATAAGTGPEARVGRPGRPGRGGGGPGSPLMAALDVNKDGVLDAAEIAHAAEVLQALDQDGDGVLTLAEICPRPGGPGMGPGKGRGQGQGQGQGPRGGGRQGGGPRDGSGPNCPLAEAPAE
jgi:hypothetical protein